MHMSLADRAISGVARLLAPIDARMTKPVAYGSRASSVDQWMVTHDRSRWSNSAVAFRSIQAITSNASSLRLQVLNEDDVEQDHELVQVWAQPNPLMSGRVFGEYLWQRLETRGETFIYLDRGETGTGPLLGMWPIFGKVTVVVDKNLAGEIVGAWVDVGGERVYLLPSEFVWLRYPDGESEWGCLSPLQAAAHAIGLDASARKWQENELEHGARPSGVVYLGDLEADQHNETVAAWKARAEGASNAGRTLFVSSAQPAKFERMSLTPAELGWMDTRASAWEEVLLAFGVSKDYLLGGATHENRDAARATLWSDTIVNKLEVVAGELARQVLDNPKLRVRFDTDDVDALHETADARATRTNGAVVVDVMTVDEARADYGLEPLSNGMGGLTLSAYRTAITLQAQAVLLTLTEDGSRQLPRVQQGKLGESFMPQLKLPRSAEQKRAGLTFDQAQTEYAMHERVGARAVARLAARQEKIVLNNLHKLFGRSGQWALKRADLKDAIAQFAPNGITHHDLTDEARIAMRAQIDKLLASDAAEDMTRSELEAFMSNVWTRGGVNTAQALGVSFDLFEIDVLLEMDERRNVLAGQVTETTRQVLEDRVLLQGVANGESVDELAVRVRSVFTDLSSWRAQTIARTETVGGFNAASHRTATDSGVAVARVWLATGDTRTRDSHVTADGERLTSFDAKYSNGCRFPGDPAAPAEETIMCRCVEQYETD